jgi:hypothetical protein
VKLRKNFPYYLLFSILLSCDSKNNVTPDTTTTDLQYFPTTIGKYVVYDVKKINFKYAQKPDTLFYQLKEVLADTFIDLEKKQAYKLERYIRYKRNKETLPNETDSTWKIDSVWSARVDPKQVLVYESNIPYVKLAFPLSNGKQWNGNQYNIKGTENYTASTFFDFDPSIKSQFESTIAIIQKNDSSAINKDKRVEVYAKNIGLIYVEKQVYEDACKYNFNGAPCVPGDKIASGLIYVQKIEKYGVETK